MTALAVAVVLIAVPEIVFRTVRDVMPSNGIKLAPEWGAQLSEAEASPDKHILVLGDSRVSWGVDCATVEAAVGPGWRCTNAGVVWGFLPHLLPIVRGWPVEPDVVLVGISAASLYSPVFEKNFADVTAGARSASWINRLDLKLRYASRQMLAIGDHGPKEIAKGVLGAQLFGLPWQHRTGHRQTWRGWNRYYIAPEVDAASKQFQIDAYGKQFLADIDPARIEPAETAVLDGLRAQAAAGSRVFLFRMPASDAIRDIEEEALDARRRLHALAARAGFPFRDFNEPGLPGGPFEVADGSHFAAHEAPPFARALGGWLAAELRGPAPD